MPRIVKILFSADTCGNWLLSATGSSDTTTVSFFAIASNHILSKIIKGIHSAYTSSNFFIAFFFSLSEMAMYGFMAAREECPVHWVMV